MDILGFEVETIPAWENQYMEFLINLLAWVLIGVLVMFVVDVVLHKLVKKTDNEFDDVLHSIIRLPIISLVVFYGFVYSFQRLTVPASVQYVAGLAYQLAFILIMFWLGWNIYDRVVVASVSAGMKKKNPGLERSIVPVMENIGKIFILFLSIMIFLGFIGVDVGLLMASFGLIGLVIAFAAQDTLANLFAGFHLLLDRPFKVGDIISLDDGDYYEVKWVGMRSTKFYNTFKNTLTIVPNSVIAGGRITNISDPDPLFKIGIKVGVSYDTDIEKAKQIILDIERSTPHILHEEGKMPFVRVIDFRDSSVELYTKFWVDHYDKQWEATGIVRQRILEEFHKQGVHIPFPQVVVHYADGKEEVERNS